MTPKEVIQSAYEYGAHGIAYTYNEPSIFIEFAKDCGIEAHKRGFFNIFVSNGYCSILKLLTLRLMFLFPIQSPQIVNNKW